MRAKRMGLWDFIGSDRIRRWNAQALYHPISKYLIRCFVLAENGIVMTLFNN